MCVWSYFLRTFRRSNGVLRTAEVAKRIRTRCQECPWTYTDTSFVRFVTLGRCALACSRVASTAQHVVGANVLRLYARSIVRGKTQVLSLAVTIRGEPDSTDIPDVMNSLVMCL